MLLKYNIQIDDKIIVSRLQNLINQVYKLLPIREQLSDWQKPLETIIEELTGIYKLMDCGYPQIFFPLLSKMEGMYSLINEDDFSCYRRTIFECLNLMNMLQKEICPQNY